MLYRIACAFISNIGLSCIVYSYMTIQGRLLALDAGKDLPFVSAGFYL